TLACASGAIVLWEVGTWRKLRTLGPREELISSLAFSPDGKTLAVGTFEETYLLDARTGKKRAPVKKRVFGLTFTPDGKTLLMVTADAYAHHAVRFQDVASGKEVRRFAGHQGHVAALAFSADGKTLASGSGDGTVGVWDVAKGTERHRLGSYRSVVIAVEFSAADTLF